MHSRDEKCILNFGKETIEMRSLEKSGQDNIKMNHVKID
jgi:hypothetical protein